MTVKMEYENGTFTETIEIDYKINMVVMTQKDSRNDFLNIITFLGQPTKDLYEMLKEMYE